MEREFNKDTRVSKAKQSLLKQADSLTVVWLGFASLNGQAPNLTSIILFSIDFLLAITSFLIWLVI